MLSVVVLTKNEQERIRGCLESVKWADEIIICDNGSIDNTLEIAKKYTDKIIKFNGQNFSELRNKGMEKVKGEWVLYLDADERVLQPLREEIKAVIENNEYSAYALSRVNIIFGSEKKYKAFWPDWVVRLIKKSDFKSWVGEIHEYAKFDGKLGFSKNSLIHLTHRDLDHIVLKSLDWSHIDAKLRYESGHPKLNGLRFLRIFLTEIFNQGVKRRGFFNGTVGVIDSLLQSFSLFMSYVRLWEMQQERPIKEVYDKLDKKLIKNGFNY